MSNLMIKIGAWAFTIGIFLALFAGLIPSAWGFGGLIVAILVVMGLIVGFLNVSDKETAQFIIASVAIMIALFTAGQAIKENILTLGIIGEYMWGVMSNINIFIFPATIVVAVKSIYSLARN